MNWLAALLLSIGLLVSFLIEGAEFGNPRDLARSIDCDVNVRDFFRGQYTVEWIDFNKISSAAQEDLSSLGMILVLEGIKFKFVKFSTIKGQHSDGIFILPSDEGHYLNRYAHRIYRRFGGVQVFYFHEALPPNVAGLYHDGENIIYLSKKILANFDLEAQRVLSHEAGHAMVAHHVDMEIDQSYAGDIKIISGSKKKFLTKIKHQGYQEYISFDESRNAREEIHKVFIQFKKLLLLAHLNRELPGSANLGLLLQDLKDNVDVGRSLSGSLLSYFEDPLFQAIEKKSLVLARRKFVTKRRFIIEYNFRENAKDVEDEKITMRIVVNREKAVEVGGRYFNKRYEQKLERLFRESAESAQYRIMGDLQFAEKMDAFTKVVNQEGLNSTDRLMFLLTAYETAFDLGIKRQIRPGRLVLKMRSGGNQKLRSMGLNSFHLEEVLRLLEKTLLTIPRKIAGADGKDDVLEFQNPSGQGVFHFSRKGEFIDFILP